MVLDFVPHLIMIRENLRNHSFIQRYDKIVRFLKNEQAIASQIEQEGFL